MSKTYCFFCVVQTCPLKNVPSGTDVFEFDGCPSFEPSDAKMGFLPVTIGKWIHHGGYDKLWCTKCILPNCGAPTCLVCEKNQIHYCFNCKKTGADHRAKDCPSKR